MVRHSPAALIAVLAYCTACSRAPAPAPAAATSAAPAAAATPAPAFLATVANPAPAPGAAPAGMVWIPGGEFSMGSHVESEALCALPGVTRDALPVHRV
jgi:formylglycine-generating enzyme required for sulfatase activity